MTRDDLFNTNISIVCDIIKVIGQVSPHALVGIISNPVSTFICLTSYIEYFIKCLNLLKSNKLIPKILFSLGNIKHLLIVLQ